MRSTTLARAALAVVLLTFWASLGVARTVTNQLRDANLLRVTVAVLFGVAAAISLTLLLRDHRNRTPRVLATLGGVGALYAAIVLPMTSPEEKAHFVQYGAVALLAWAALPADWRTGRRFVGAALFTLGAGWIRRRHPGTYPEPLLRSARRRVQRCGGAPGVGGASVDPVGARAHRSVGRRSSASTSRIVQYARDDSAR